MPYFMPHPFAGLDEINLEPWHDVARTVKGGFPDTVYKFGVPANVIEVKMRVDDMRHIFGPNTESREF
jgi:hypothetical protein